MVQIFKIKNIIFTLMIIILILFVGYAARYIYNQNVEYQRLSEKKTIEQDIKDSVEEEIPAKVEPSESEWQTPGTVESEFRDNSIMIF